MLGRSSPIHTIRSALFCPSVVRIQIEPLPFSSPDPHQHICHGEDAAEAETAAAVHHRRKRLLRSLMHPSPHH
jgi:hypothetical protein